MTEISRYTKPRRAPRREAHHDYLASQKGKATELVVEYESYAKRNSHRATFHYLLGKAYATAARYKEAQVQYQKALDIDAEFSWALLELGALAYDRGRSWRRRPDHCKGAGPNEPDHPWRIGRHDRWM